MYKNDIKKDFFWNSLGSLIYSCTSLLFLIIVTRINGTNIAGIFTFAFSNACLFHTIGIYSGRSYQVTETNSEITDSDYIYNKVFSVFLMLFLGIIFAFFKGYNSLKLLIVFLLIVYKAADAFCESTYAIIQKNGRLSNVGISLLLKGAVGIIIFFIADLITKNITLSVISFIITYVLIFLIYDLQIIRQCNYKMEKFNIKNILLIFKLGFWTFGFTFLTQYLINSPKYAIDTYLTNDVQTIYGIIAMPATMIMLASTFLIQPLILKFKNLIMNKESNEINKLLLKIIIALTILFVLCELFLYFLGIPLLKVLYGLNLKPYLFNLLIVFFGAFIYGITMIISNVLIAMRKTMSQTIIFLVTSVIAYVISNSFVKSFGINGASVGYTIIMLILLAMYIVDYIYIMSKLKKEVK